MKYFCFRVVEPIASKVRPRRLGLGADASILSSGEKPVIKKGSFIKGTAGRFKDEVGVVESFDADAGSIIIKMAGNTVVSLSETVVISITKKEYEDSLHGNLVETLVE